MTGRGWSAETSCAYGLYCLPQQLSGHPAAAELIVVLWPSRLWVVLPQEAREQDASKGAGRKVGAQHCVSICL